MRSALIVLLLLFCMSSWSQDQDSATEAPVVDGPPAPESAAGEAAEAGIPGDEPDDADLDEQTYERDDDVFVPTEEIPVDQSIPFPTDI